MVVKLRSSPRLSRPRAIFGDDAVVVGGERFKALEVEGKRGAGWALGGSDVDSRRHGGVVSIAGRRSPFEVVVGVFAVADEGAVEGGADSVQVRSRDSVVSPST